MDYLASQDDLVAVVAGDQNVLAKLLVEFAPQLSRRIEQKLQFNPFADFGAEDVLQEVFVDVVRSIGAFRGDTHEQFRGWLCTIADHRLAAVMRDRSTKKRGGRKVAVGPVSQSESGSFKAVVELLADTHRSTASVCAYRDELVEHMRQAIAELPSDQRHAVATHFLEQRSVESTAEKLEKTPAAVRGLIHRAKKAMQDALGNSSRWFSRKG